MHMTVANLMESLRGLPYDFKKIKSCSGRDGIAWSCEIYKGALKFASADNSGSGGPTSFWFYPGYENVTREVRQEAENEFRKWCQEWLMKYSHDADFNPETGENDITRPYTLADFSEHGEHDGECVCEILDRIGLLKKLQKNIKAGYLMFSTDAEWSKLNWTTYRIHSGLNTVTQHLSQNKGSFCINDIIAKYAS